MMSLGRFVRSHSMRNKNKVVFSNNGELSPLQTVYDRKTGYFYDVYLNSFFWFSDAFKKDGTIKLRKDLLAARILRDGIK